MQEREAADAGTLFKLNSQRWVTAKKDAVRLAFTVLLVMVSLSTSDTSHAKKALDTFLLYVRSPSK